jgi:beta-xylosidase
MKKYLLIISVLCLIMGLVSCNGDAILKETPVDALNLTDLVAAPVIGQLPQTTVTHAQYNGVVEWQSVAGPQTTPFIFGAVYTAVARLTSVTGYTFEDLEENSFTHAGAATVTNAEGSGTVAIAFPATRYIDSPRPTFQNVTIHDPSIFRVNDTSTNDRFRIIGSFLSAARTGDFIRWTMDSPGGHETTYPSTLKYYPQDNPNPAVQKVDAQRADVMRGNRDGFNFYASDIIRMPDGRFFHYYSMTSSATCSAIGVAIATTANGPYITQGLFVRSAEAGNNRTPDNSMAFNSQIHPNCIDSHTFIDKTGTRLFMSYGSWSGGIFMLELDMTTGLRKAGAAINDENQGYGRLLIASRRVAVEAPYILYSPESDYYYLFLSFGWLCRQQAIIRADIK